MGSQVSGHESHGDVVQSSGVNVLSLGFPSSKQIRLSEKRSGVTLKQQVPDREPKELSEGIIGTERMANTVRTREVKAHFMMDLR